MNVSQGSASTEDAVKTTEVSTAGPAVESPGGPRWLPRSVSGRILLGAGVLVLLALGAGGWYWYQSTHLPAGVAFRVYDRDVSAGELEDAIQTNRALYGLKPPVDGPKLDEFRRDFAKAQAVSLVLDHAAADRHIAVADRQVSDVLARYITQFYGEGATGRDRYIQALADQGTSEPKVLEEIKRQMVLRQLASQVTAGVTVSDEDVRRAFDQRRDKLGRPERRELLNIVVRDRAEADQIVAALNGGAKFEDLAARRSADTTTKTKGGNLGLIAAVQLQKSYADAAFAAPVGAVFGPVQTTFGYNVGRVVQSQPPMPAEFDEVSDQLRQLLIKEKAVAEWNKFMAGLIQDADVRYADEYRPANPDALPGADQPPAPDAAGSPPPPAAGPPAAPGPPAGPLPAPAPAPPR